MKKYFSVIAILALAACTKEFVPDGVDDALLRTETLKARIATTKVEINDAGKFSWTAGDEIAIHRSVNGYETAVLTADGSFKVHLAEGETRDGYAVYPATLVDAAVGLTVNLPAAYTIPKEGMGDYSPLPMVAINNPDSEDLIFHHLGGIIRLSLDSVPFETQQIVVNLGKKVTGSFIVADADTDAPYISLTADAAEDIVYTLSSPVASTYNDFTLNIPAPMGDYESVSLKVYDRYGHLVVEKEEFVEVSVGRADGFEIDSELKVDVSVIPLCLKLARKGTVSVDNNLGLTMEYSLDNETWNSFNSDLNVEIDKGGVIYFRGNNASYAVSSSYKDCTRITCSAKAYLYGNIMSLITPLPQDFSTLDEFTEDYTFSHLFYDEDGNPIAPRIVNHPSLDLLLPAKTLSAYCYHNMFYLCGIDRIELPATTMKEGCYSEMFDYCRFVTAPALPATILAKECYSHMFENNGLLINAPELPAETLAERCYYGMFDRCKLLQVAPELPATELASGCYGSMFSGCSSLTTTPSLPATTVSPYAYQSMFYDCFSLTTITDFPATSFSDYACQDMFSGCTSLESCPDFQAVNLGYQCCSGMFNGCTSLASAPVLPATSLAPHCYENMFKNCSSLSYLKAMFTTGYDDDNVPLGEWLLGVSETGTFVMNSMADYDPVSDAGVPSGWTIETASE